MRWKILLLLLVSACGRDALLRPIEGRPALVLRGEDAGQPAAKTCALPFGGPACCDGAGQRVTSASCEGGTYLCASGTLCECQGQAAPFHCSDTCGSDAFVEAQCGADGWFCPPGLRSTADCPEGTCWGEPGDCCLGPRCEALGWTCASIREPCQ